MAEQVGAIYRYLEPALHSPPDDSGKRKKFLGGASGHGAVQSGFTNMVLNGKNYVAFLNRALVTGAETQGVLIQAKTHLTPRARKLRPAKYDKAPRARGNHSF